jgi:prepilin-type N-terminal cleavage/methylation domain-containing protein
MALKVSKSRSAFSLVELSIVLVILGLIVGGVLSGQALIHGAELRAVNTEIQKYGAAYYSFRDRYFGLPGDITNASQFWGAADGAGNGNSAACATTQTNDKRTCNGNGDGKMTISTASYENYRAPQQLASAGLIEGSYNSYVCPTCTGTSPASKLGPNVLWFVDYYETVAGSGIYAGSTDEFAGQMGNALSLNTSAAPYTVLNAEDTWNIDTKIDDGVPNTGRLWSNKGSTAYPCTTKAGLAVGSDSNPAYNLSNKAINCYFYLVKI